MSVAIDHLYYLMLYMVFSLENLRIMPCLGVIPEISQVSLHSEIFNALPAVLFFIVRVSGYESCNRMNFTTLSAH